MPKNEEEVPVTIRFPKDLHGWAKDRAEEEDRTLNAVVVRALKAAREQAEREQKKAR